ncbi:glycosyltransferase family 2 protein [Candidatus Woesearchaeota archaeon]|nr:glycosyltransferase family 2 protein [Candidatus Woesearchaeota archaeon]
MDIAIVIAAYNEQGSVGKVVKNLHKHNYQHIIVVDDGSKDKTSEEATEAGAIVLRHIINRGQGAALQTGISYALKQGANIIITFDADGQHKAKDIPKFIKPIEKGEADVCLGSRFLKNTNNAPFMRRVILKGGALSLRIFYGLKLTDSHNGFRALSRKAANKIKIKSDGMEHASEIIEQIADNKLKYKEIPNTITYSDETLAKGQGNSNAINIMTKMILGKLKR